MANWIQHRIRSRNAATVLPLAILGIIQTRELTEWELMNLLYKLFGSLLNVKEVRSILRDLVKEGFVEVDGKKSNSLLRVSRDGLKLLSGLDKECDTIRAELMESSQW